MMRRNCSIPFQSGPFHRIITTTRGSFNCQGSNLATGKFPLNLLWSTSTVLNWKYIKLGATSHSVLQLIWGLIAWFHHLEPIYKLRRYLTESFDSKRIWQAEVAELVQAQYVICTTDIWTSPVHDSLLSLTAHFITTDFEKKLQAVKFSKSQPATTLQAW